MILSNNTAALVFSTHSPDFPCSPSDFIPSSEGSIPEDSRIPGSVRCMFWRLSGQPQRQTPKILLSQAVLTQTSPIFYFPTKIRLIWHQEIHPGAAAVCFPLWVYLFKASPSVIQYTQPLPLYSNGLLGKEEELSPAVTMIFPHYSNTHTHRWGEEPSLGVGLQAGERRCVCSLTPAGSTATGLPAVELPEGLSNLMPLKQNIRYHESLEHH